MATKQKFNVVFFTVRSKGTEEFPLDMLRYDSCAPATGSDVTMMGCTELSRKLVKLRRFYPVGGKREPNGGRWLSFGWVVEDVYDEAGEERPERLLRSERGPL